MKKKVLFTVVTTVFISALTACGGETKDIVEDTNRSQEVVSPSTEPADVDVPETVEPTAEPAPVVPEVAETAMKDWYVGIDMECERWEQYGGDDTIYIQMPEDAYSGFNADMEVTFYYFNYKGVKMSIWVTTYASTSPQSSFLPYEKEAPYYIYEEFGDSSIEAYVTPGGIGRLEARTPSRDYCFYVYTMLEDNSYEACYEACYNFMVNMVETLKPQIH